jgi:hypothetical protein
MKLSKLSLLNWRIIDSNNNIVGCVQKELSLVGDYYCVIEYKNYTMLTFKSFQQAKNFIFNSLNKEFLA